VLAASCGEAPKKLGGAITVLNWGTETEGKVWNELATEFTAKTGIKVNIETAEWSVYWDKISTLYAANTPPEVFAMDAPLFPDWLSRDALQSLQPYIDKDPATVEGLYPASLKAYKTDKGYFGLPRDFQTIVLYYNKALFDKAGVKYPTADWTWDDLKAAAKKLTLKDAKGKVTQWGFSPDLYDIEGFMSSLVWSYGGEIVSPDAKKTLIADKREPWKLVWSMIRDDQSIPSTDMAAQYGSDLFVAGKSAMITSGHWSVPDYSQLPFGWDVVPMPKGPAGRATSVNSAGFVMAKKSANPDAGWAWIQFILSKDGQTKLAQLGFAIPARKEIAESQAFLGQTVKIDHKMFLDAIEYAHVKPGFKGYDAWSSAFGDAMTGAWDTTKTMDAVLDAAVAAGDKAMAAQK
jgi:multiple sugar transport system substrate-binding protein